MKCSEFLCIELLNQTGFPGQISASGILVSVVAVVHEEQVVNAVVICGKVGTRLQRQAGLLPRGHSPLQQRGGLRQLQRRPLRQRRLIRHQHDGARFITQVPGQTRTNRPERTRDMRGAIFHAWPQINQQDFVALKAGP